MSYREYFKPASRASQRYKNTKF